METDADGAEDKSSSESKSPGNVHLLENVTLDDIAGSNLPSRY
jgi:hypothetical protein